MTSVNKVILIGNIGKNPSTHTLDNGSKFAAFSLATTSSWKTPSGECKQDTTWHNILCYSALANIAAQYLEKGLSVYVEGRLSNRTKTDSNGNKFSTTSIIAESINILTPKGYKPSSSLQNTPTPSLAPAPAQNLVQAQGTHFSEFAASPEELVALGFTTKPTLASTTPTPAPTPAQNPWNTPTLDLDTGDDIPF